MMMFRSTSLLAAALWLATSLRGVSGQFTCTLSANDENACLATLDDSKHCVWCAVTSFHFCVSETQAESMEANIPGVQCQRYSGDDDATDDATPAVDDDAAPAPNDDELPDDYWLCLKKKDSKECLAEGCTWCDSKGGFGLCLTGPSADMANDSDWFTCTKEDEPVAWQLRGHKETAPAKDPYDPSCLAAFLQDPSADGCTGAMDADGQACEFCSFQDSIDICLTAEQAEMAEQFGISCDGEATAEETAVEDDGLSDPYDPSCALAYLQDQSEEACKNAVDSDGNACEYCTLQGQMNFCLNDEQAAMAEQFGMECDGEEEESPVQDPYDPSCALAFLQEQSKEACTSAVDSDGNPCEYCTLQGSLNLCLNEEQAQMGEALGIECETSEGAGAAPASTLGFPSDLWDCLQNYDEGGCASNSCTWCNTEVGIGFCMADAAADAMRECNFFDCNYKTPSKEQEADVDLKAVVEDIHPFDPACLGGMESEEVCKTTQDSNGGACVWCDAAGVFGLCLSADGAEAASDYLTCGTAQSGVTTKVW